MDGGLPLIRYAPRGEGSSLLYISIAYYMQKAGGGGGGRGQTACKNAYTLMDGPILNQASYHCIVKQN